MQNHKYVAAELYILNQWVKESMRKYQKMN